MHAAMTRFLFIAQFAPCALFEEMWNLWKISDGRKCGCVCVCMGVGVCGCVCVCVGGGGGGKTCHIY